MSIHYMMQHVDKYMGQFANSFTELKIRSENAVQELQRRISTLEKRPVYDEAYVERITREILAEHHLIEQRNDSADPQVSTSTDSRHRPIFDEAHVRRVIEKVLAEHHLIDERHDSVINRISASTTSASPTDVLCSRCHGPVNASPIILPSFDELSRGIDPMDVSFEPLATSGGPGEAWTHDFTKLYGSDGYSNPDLAGDSGRQDKRCRTFKPIRQSAHSSHQGHPAKDYNPNHWP